MPTPILYCSDPLNPRRVDDHFAGEASSARDVGATVSLIDHDALLAGEAEAAVRRVPRDLGSAWYRGWMIPSDRYRLLAAALAERGIHLVVGPVSYRAAHELPGWYAPFEDVTPRSVWMPSRPGTVPDRDELASLVAPLGSGAAVVKDFVKSRKHEWNEACYVPDVTDTNRLYQVVARFVELQEDFLAGGIVARAFEPFTAHDEAAAEARIWWLDAEPILTGPHPDTPDRAPLPQIDGIRSAVASLGCRFITTDMALRTDGTWRVVEVGDGQVSDLPRTVDPTEMMTALSTPDAYVGAVTPYREVLIRDVGRRTVGREFGMLGSTGTRESEVPHLASRGSSAVR